MSAWSQDRGHGDADMAAPAQGHTASPKGAGVYFYDPIHGIRVPRRFAVQVGLRGMGMAPAGAVRPMTGYNDLLVGVDKIDLNQPTSDSNLIHLGNGRSEVVLTPKPGTHALQLLTGDHAHMPQVMSKKITIYVR